MSKKRNFYIEYLLPVNGNEFPKDYTVTGVQTKEDAAKKLNALCRQNGGPEPIIKSITEVR